MHTYIYRSNLDVIKVPEIPISMF